MKCDQRDCRRNAKYKVENNGMLEICCSVHAQGKRPVKDWEVARR